MNTKADIINSAYSQLRISGITVNPNGNDIALAIGRLENMVAEWEVDIGYNFELVPDPSSDTNVERKYWNALETNLALRLIADFNKQPPQELKNLASASLSNLMSKTLKTRTVPYPSRHPKGSGNRIAGGFINPFYPPDNQAPNSPQTEIMYKDDINDFTESYAAFLRDSETIISYTLTADEGLTVLSQSLATPEILYQVQATGSSNESDILNLQIVLRIVTDAGRRVTRVKYFQILVA